MNISSLSNEELRDALRQFGQAPGPILATTRKVYENKLIRLVQNDQMQQTKETTSFTAVREIRTPPSPRDEVEEFYDDEDEIEEVEEFEGEESFRFVKEEPQITYRGAATSQWPKSTAGSTPSRYSRVTTTNSNYSYSPVKTTQPQQSIPWWVKVVIFILIVIFGYFLIQRIADTGDQIEQKEE